MPARSVVIEKLSKWNGETHADITPGEYTQLTGRAGRRGIDVEGHGVVLWQQGFDPQGGRRPGLDAHLPAQVVVPAVVQHGGQPGAPGRPGDRARAAGVVVRAVPGRQGGRRAGPAAAQGRGRRSRATPRRRPATSATSWSTPRCAAGSPTPRPPRPGARRADRRDEVVESLEALRPGDVIEVPAGRFSGMAVVLDPGTARGPRRAAALRAHRRPARAAALDGRLPGAGRGVHPDADPARLQRPQPAVTPRPRLDAADPHAGLHPAAPPGPGAAAADARAPGRRRSRRSPGCAPSCARTRATAARTARTTPAGPSATTSSTGTPDPAAPDRAAHQHHRPAVRPGLRGAHRARLPRGRRGHRDRRAADADLHRHGPGRRRVAAPRPVGRAVRRASWPPRCRRWSSSPGAPTTPSRRGCPAAGSSRCSPTWSRCGRDLDALEREHKLDFLREPDLGFAWAAYRWAEGAALDEVLHETDLAAGDFVRWVKQLLDLTDQVADAAGDGAPAQDRPRGVRRPPPRRGGLLLGQRLTAASSDDGHRVSCRSSHRRWRVQRQDGARAGQRRLVDRARRVWDGWSPCSATSQTPLRRPTRTRCRTSLLLPPAAVDHDGGRQLDPAAPELASRRSPGDAHRSARHPTPSSAEAALPRGSRRPTPSSSPLGADDDGHIALAVRPRPPGSAARTSRRRLTATSRSCRARRPGRATPWWSCTLLSPMPARRCSRRGRADVLTFLAHSSASRGLAGRTERRATSSWTTPSPRCSSTAERSQLTGRFS